MPVFEVDALLQPVSAEAPCGPDLSYDPAFSELETLARGKPAEEFLDPSGKAIVIPGSEPPWREVKAKAIDLLKRSRDLRILVYLALAAVREHGFVGLRDSLVLLQGLAEKHWDHIHPLPDPDDKDPVMRVNAVSGLVAPMGTFDDQYEFVAKVLDSPLTNSRQLGRFSLRHHRIAKGEIPASVLPEGTQAPQASQIAGAFKDTPLEELNATRAAVVESLAAVAAIRNGLNQTVGPERTPIFTPLEQVLKEAQQLLDTHLGGTPPAEGGDQPAAAPAERSGPGGPALSGEIRSSADVLSALEKICRYYERNEVSSPVPMIMAAAKRLVGRNFPEISRVLTPDAIKLLEEMGNPPQESKTP